MFLYKKFNKFDKTDKKFIQQNMIKKVQNKANPLQFFKIKKKKIKNKKLMTL